MPLIATLTALPSPEVLGDLSDVAVLEVRADLLGDIAPETLRGQFRGQLLYPLRSQDEGGGFTGRTMSFSAGSHSKTAVSQDASLLAAAATRAASSAAPLG